MKYSLQKRISAFVLAFALVMTTAFNSIGATTSASAAVKVKGVYKSTNAKAATVVEGTVKTFKIGVWTSKAVKKATVKKKLKVTSSNTDVVEVTTKTIKATQKTKKNAKKAGKASVFQYTAVKAGTATITAKYGKKKASFKVTVTAKSVEPTPASQDASKEPTPVAPSVESLEVEASNGLSIGETEQTVLTVKSGTKGAEIVASSVTFKSENPAVLSVDEKTGKVTGLKAGSGEVTITAQDLNGKTITKKVTITVTALAEAKITVSDKSYTIKAGSTVTLNPSVTPANYASALTFESSNPAIASVDEKGVVTGVAAGDGVTITIKAKGTTGVATVAITVVAEGYGIASAEPVKANQIKVNFTTPISKADQAILGFDVKLTSSVSVKASFDATGASAILTNTAGNFNAGTYNVTLTGKNLILDDKTKTANVVVAALEAKKVVITGNKVFAPSDKIKVNYEVVDQYGDKMANYTADKLIWTLAYKDSTINTAVAKAIDNNAKYDGFIYLNIGGAGGINLSPLTTLNPSAQADFTLTAYVKSTPSINGSGTVSVKKLKIEKVKILGITSSDALDKAVPYTGNLYVNTTSSVDYRLIMSGADENGEPIDWSAYKSGGYSNSVNVLASWTKATGVTALDGDFANMETLAKGSTVDKTNTSCGLLTIPANWWGDISVSAIASVEKASEESMSSFKLTVKPTPAATKVVWPSSISVAKGGSTLINVSFLDQDGKAIETPNANPITALDLTGLTDGGIAGKKNSITYEKPGVYKLTISATEASKSGEITSAIGTNITPNAKFTITDASTTDDISSDAKASYDILVGQEQAIDFYAIDQYDQNITTASSSYGVALSDATVIGVDDTTGTAAAGIDASVGNATNSAATGTDAKGVKGYTKLFVYGAKTGTSTITVSLYKIGAGAIGTNAPVATKKITINVLPTPKYFAASIADEKVESGKDVKIKLTAYGADDKVMSSFKADVASAKFFEINNVDVTGTPYANGAVKTLAKIGDLSESNIGSEKPIKFEGGSAIYTIQANKVSAGDDGSTSIQLNAYVGRVTLANGKNYGSDDNTTYSSATLDTDAKIKAAKTNTALFAFTNVTAGDLESMTVTPGTLGSAAVTFTGADAKSNVIDDPLEGYKVYATAKVMNGATLNIADVMTEVDADTGLLNKAVNPQGKETAFKSVINSAANIKANCHLTDGDKVIITFTVTNKAGKTVSCSTSETTIVIS